MVESEMFDYLKLKYPDLIKSPNLTDGYDCLSKDANLYIELKSRNTHYDTLLLEEKKYNFLINTAKELGMVAKYINWTPKGMWSFTLTDNPSDYEWSEKWLPVTTEFANNSKIMKMVTFLNVADGELI